MSSLLSTARLATILCLGLACGSVAKAETAPPRLVLARTAEVMLVDAHNLEQPIPVGLVLDVLSVDGDLFWTGRGWVRQADVVAVGDAVEFFTTVTVSKPSPFVYVSRARAHAQLGANEEALADCRRALALDADFAPAHCQMGRAQTGLRRLNAALESLGRAIELDEQNAIAYCCRAQTHLAMHDTAAALEDYDRAIDLDERLVVAIFGRAVVRSQQGNLPGALTDLDDVLRRHPGHFPALNNRANLFARRKEWVRAVNDYSTALEQVRRPDIYMNRSQALRAAGRLQEAIADCNEAIRLAPELESAYRQRAALLTEEGRSNEAAFDLNRAESLAQAGNRT